ncbi:FeoC-like transcriptional regulator [Psychromonas aquimarina]|uniref:FeoC-like transcriptional regulator n=1 Tax=Psychromonas aquimarina TaxID=444919 RepID=UPI0004292430|nr:FeoC-like transcriptional regulator [Psychromonas aquimarina]
MILQSLSDYIEKSRRVKEETLLKHFRLSSEGLQPMMAVLLKRGKIHKTINQRGKNLPPEIFYSWSENTQIPTLTVV